VNQLDASLLAFTLTSGGLIGYLAARMVDAIPSRRKVGPSHAEQLGRLAAWKAQLEGTAKRLEARQVRIRALGEELAAIHDESRPRVQVELCSHRTAGGKAFCEVCSGAS
jgi:hypothetical protein